MTDVARNEDSDKFKDMINRYKDLGALYAYQHGGTVSIKDMVLDRSYRDDLIKKYKPRIDKMKDKDKKVEAWNSLVEKMEEEQNKKIKKGNNMWELIDTGALSASKAGNVRQVLTAPGVVADTRGNPVEFPVFKSYSEGLGTFDYFNTLPGVRKGIVDKSVNTQESGALTNSLLAVNRRLLVTEEDCDTDEGLNLELQENEIQDRVLLETVPGVGKRGDVVDSGVINRAKAKKLDTLKVRSALTCDSVQGVCQKCYGLLPGGKLPDVGTNVGILDSEALTERSTQLTMSTFHCMHGRNIVFLKISGKLQLSTFESLWEEFGSYSEETIPGQREINLPEGYKIWDAGKWTRALKIIRHKQHPNTKMVMTRSRDNSFIVSQDNHPHMLALNSGICEKCETPFKKPKKLGYYKCPDCGKVPHKVTHKSSGNYNPVEPKDVIKSKYFSKTSIPESKILKSIEPRIDPYLIGVHLSEGSTGGRDGNVYYWTITQNPGDMQEKFRGHLEKYGKVSQSDNNHLTICSKEIATEVESLYGKYSRNKSLPFEFINYSDEDLGAILSGVVDGDGSWIDKENLISIESTSLLMVQQIGVILKKLKIKYAVTLSTVRQLTRNQSYTLKIFPSRGDEKIFVTSYKLGDATFPKRSNRNDRDGLVNYVKEVLFDPEDFVYDIETESHTLSVNGFWTHNTGGAVGKDGGSSFPRLEQLIKVPQQITGKAALAPVRGIVKDLKKNNIGG